MTIDTVHNKKNNIQEYNRLMLIVIDIIYLRAGHCVHYSNNFVFIQKDSKNEK